MKKLNKNEIFKNIQEESNVYSNFRFIYEKVVLDGYLEKFFDLFTYIFENEIEYANKGDLMRIGKIKFC
jgi:hypothetical protein